MGVSHVLPHENDLKCWNKQKIQRIIFEDKMDNYRKILPDYQMSPAMIAMYNFVKCPILDQYKTVIFDRDQGIVLTQKTTRQIINEFVKKKTFNFLHSRLLHEKLGLKEHHALCYGNYNYFALDGYSRKNVDWVSLHQVNKIDIVHDQSSFIAEDGMVFHFEKDYWRMKNNMIDAVEANNLFVNDLKRVGEEVGVKWKTLSEISNSLAHNQEYFKTLRTKSDELILPEALKAQRSRQLQNFFNREFGIKATVNDLNLLQQEIKKREYLW